MEDLILNSYLADFATRFDYTSVKETTKFEYFVAHCLVAQEYQGHFDADELSLGEANGIDSLAIFVNDVLVGSEAEIESLAKHNIEVRFLFVQSKTSARYDQGDILKFTSAVKYFFSREQKPDTYPLLEWHRIKEALYRKAIRFTDNPTLEMCYATTSLARPNELLSNSAQQEIQVLEATRLFSRVNLQFVNSEDLKAIYRKLSNKVTKQISFERHTILPKIQGVKRAYIGILPCTEFLKLIRDENKKLLKNVFYDNVRDYQGANPVNREILSTLARDEANKEAFVLLNNGVTVVCRSINPVGTDFTVRDFQVVNGCQTSHVLHRNEELLSGNEFLTIKLIETEDVDLANRITKATNRQTEVKLEAFAGLQPFHKELEAFYASIPLMHRLYYERRPGQYDFESSVNQSRIISIPNQIRAFVSVVLEEPQKIHFYYGQLLEAYSAGDESTLFSETHDPYPYFIAARLVFLVTDRIKKRARKLLKWRYHVAAMVRMKVGGPFNRSRLSDPVYSKRYCDAVLAQTENFEPFVDAAIDLLMEKIKIPRPHRTERDLPQDSALVVELLTAIKADYFAKQPQDKKSNLTDTEKFDGVFVGSVSQVVPEKRYGFIDYGQRRFFFKFSEGSFQSQSKVRFRVRRNGDSTEAFDVVVI